MSPFIRLSLIIVLSMLCLTGCWSSSEVQDINYTIAIGLDYVEGEYVVYVQFLDFSNVAKQEGGKAQQNKVWVGQARDPELTIAFTKLYKSSQQRVYWDHMGAIVLSERLLRHGYQDAIELINRYRESRYNVWVYGTNEPLADILSTASFFRLSSINSILIEPSEAYKQLSLLPPLYWYKLIRNNNEKGTTSLIPSLTVDKKTWKENKQPQDLLFVDGAYVYSHGSYLGKLAAAKLRGLQWQQKQTERYPLQIRKENRIAAVLMVQRPQVRVNPLQEGDNVRYRLSLKLDAFVLKLTDQKISMEELEALAVEEIQKQVLNVYNNGLAIHADLFQLSEALYRSDPKTWRNQVEKHGDLFLSKDSLNVEAQVRIIHSSKYKNQPSPS